jgi:1,4-alpha-glucan branching enzyme
VPLAIVLHTHMPYVEGYGTWPFGEEWLWEAMATSYLPLLDVLDRAPELTLSLTPVLCDQLEAPGVAERFRAFMGEMRTVTHELDAAAARAAGDEALAAEIERSAGDYVRALERFDALGGDLLGALGRHAAWTSSATHAVLPLLATDAGVRLQLAVGVEAHRRRFVTPAPTDPSPTDPRPAWRGGLWLPECAYDPWLASRLAEAGVRATCVDLTDVFGMGAPGHLHPIAQPGGPVLVPIDRSVIELVWSDHGYPSNAAYRDSHERTEHHHKAWRVDGGLYDAGAAREQARADARDFVVRVAQRTAGGGLCVCALDTELLGHWWYEGPAWLGFVVDECREQGVELVHLDDALEAAETAEPPRGGVPPTTWGRGRDLSTWDGPAVADLAWAAREAELRAVAAGASISTGAVRALLALQASDWAFVISEQFAEPYGRERAAGHLAEFDAELRGEPSDLRAIAPHASPAPLLAP